jgi:hypothetical protein
VLPLPGSPGYPPKLDGTVPTSQEVLPNLVSLFPGIPVVPADPGYPAVRAVGGRTLLFFDSGFKNAGPGRVLVRGHRRSTSIRDMSADQYIQLKSGKYALRHNAGALRYIFPTGIGLPHLHWHYLGAEVYAIYRVGQFGHFYESHKQGFCMSEFLPNDFTNYCGYKQPDELTQIVGMNPNTADYYGAGVEGQDIDITGFPAGRYVLINWLNSACQLAETTYADNAASTAFTLSYPNGQGALPVITLGAELDRVPHLPCPAPTMTSSQAVHYLQQAVTKRTRASAASVRSHCTRVKSTEFKCSVSWRTGAATSSGHMTIQNVASAKLALYAKPLDGITAQTVFSGTASGRRQQWSMSFKPLATG